MRTNTISLVLALFGVALFTTTLRAADDFAVGPVIAKGKGLEIRRSQLDDAFIAFRANLAARGQNLAEGRREGAEAQLLDRIIVTQLLVNQATAADREKARTNAVKFFDESRKMADSEEGFRRYLKSLGMTLAQFTNRAVEQAISEEVINREIKSKIVITEAEMQHFYDTNGEAFKQPEIARATHILIATKDAQTGLPMSAQEKAAPATTSIAGPGSVTVRAVGLDGTPSVPSCRLSFRPQHATDPSFLCSAHMCEPPTPIATTSSRPCTRIGRSLPLDVMGSRPQQATLAEASTAHAWSLRIAIATVASVSP